MNESAVAVDRPGPTRYVEGHYFAAQFDQPPGPDGDFDTFVDTYRQVDDVEDARLLAHWEAVVRILQTVDQSGGAELEQTDTVPNLPAVPEELPVRADPLPVGVWQEGSRQPWDTPARTTRFRRIGRRIMAGEVMAMAAIGATEGPGAWKSLHGPLQAIIRHGHKVIPEVSSTDTRLAGGVGILTIAAAGIRWWRKNRRTAGVEASDTHPVAQFLGPSNERLFIPAGSRQLS